MSQEITGELLLTELKEDLESMPFAQWDRFTTGEWGDNEYVQVYGWIDRKDAYKDFVLVILWDNGQGFFTTSSTEYTEDIFQVLFDDSLDEHNDCQRVEDYLNIENKVEL